MIIILVQWLFTTIKYRVILVKFKPKCFTIYTKMSFKLCVFNQRYLIIEGQGERMTANCGKTHGKVKSNH